MKFHKTMALLTSTMLMSSGLLPNVAEATTTIVTQNSENELPKKLEDDTIETTKSSTQVSLEQSVLKITGTPVSISTNFTGKKTSADTLIIDLVITTDNNNSLNRGDKIIVNLDSTVVNYDTLSLTGNIDKYFSYTFDKESSQLIFTSKLDLTTEGKLDIQIAGSAYNNDATTTLAANVVDNEGTTQNIANIDNPTLVVVKTDNPNPQTPGVSITGGIPTWYSLRYPHNQYSNNSLGLDSDGSYNFEYSQPYHFYTCTFAVRDASELGSYINQIQANNDILEGTVYAQKLSSDGTTIEDISDMVSVEGKSLNLNLSNVTNWEIYSISFAVKATLPSDTTTVTSTISQNSSGTTLNASAKGKFLTNDNHGFLPHINGGDLVVKKNTSNVDLLSGLSANDVEDGDITSKIKVTDEGGFDVTKAGEYIVHYSVTDSDDNTANFQRTITVVEVIGGDVTAKYVDTDGNKISDDVVKSGNVGDDYTTDQKTIAGYTFKEVQGSATGRFTDQAQTVTYVYTKNNVTPSPKPDDHSETPESSKDNGNKNSTTLENKNTLPQTGDNEVLSTFGIISGILLILGTIASILVKRKRKD